MQHAYIGYVKHVTWRPTQDKSNGGGGEKGGKGKETWEATNTYKLCGSQMNDSIK
jgi:hypothetical protein